MTADIQHPTPNTHWGVVGHERAIKLLRAGLERSQLPHSLLLAGPRQVGKRTLAIALSRMVNCSGQQSVGQESGSIFANPCGVCRACRLSATGGYPDMHLVQLREGRQKIGIRDVQALQGELARRPSEGRRRVALIVDAERLSPEAENCLLKTLEEPPPHALIVLTTEDADALLPTTVSRCRQVRLKPVPAEIIERHLASELGVDLDRARLLSALADGRPGWAITAASKPQNLADYNAVLERLVLAVNSGKLGRLEISRRLAERWPARADFIRDELRIWAGWWRDVLLVKLGLIERAANVERVDELARQAGRYAISDLQRAVAALVQAQADLDQNVNPRLALDVALLRLPQQADG